jgi:hypothetical protein
MWNLFKEVKYTGRLRIDPWLCGVGEGGIAVCQRIQNSRYVDKQVQNFNIQHEHQG